MAAAGSNNVYVDIIFRLQAEAAKRAERILGHLIKKGQLATLTLQKFRFPSDFPKSAAEATNRIFKLSQQASEASRTSSLLWKSAIQPLTEELRRNAKSLLENAAILEIHTLSQWNSIKSNKTMYETIRKLGATEENYRSVLNAKASKLRALAKAYLHYANDLEKGGFLLKKELASQRDLWRIYQLTGIRLEGLNESLIRHSQALDSILPMRERIWKPMRLEIRALASGLNTLNRESADTLMYLTRNAAAAEAFGEPAAFIDRSASRLLKSLSPLNYQLAKMGISQAITSEFSLALAKGQAHVAEETLRQARAAAEAAANFDRLALPVEKNLILGSQLYDIFKDNARMVLELEDSIREATGVLDYHSKGLHLVNRALRAQNANFEINYQTLKRITQEGWGAFTEEQKRVLKAIYDSYQAERRFTGSLSSHQKALLQLIESTEEYDKALHFQLRTAQDAEFLLKRLQRVGYEGLTEAERRAINELEKNIGLTWTWDARTKTLAQRIIAAKNAYTEQNIILREMTPRQRIFYNTILHLQGGFSRLSRFIDRVSIGSLKLLGPLFLVTAAINTIGRIVGTCVDSFIRYETALMDLRISGGLAADTANRLSRAFTSLERILPISTADMLSIARAAAKAGVTGETELKRFTLALVKFTQVTGWSADEASEALLKISRAFKIPIENAESLASMMHHLAVVSVADADDISNALSRIGAAAVNLGITADEAAAMATTLIDAGMGAERAGTRLRAFLREFLEKSDKIVAIMEDAGEEFQDFGDIIRENPGKALKMFLKYLSGINNETERARIVYEIFGSVAGFAVLTLAEHYSLLEKRMQEAHREMVYGTRLSKDFSKWMDAASMSLKQASNSFDRLKRSIGAALGPPLATGAKWLSGIIEDLFPSARGGIQIMTEGTQEWLDTFQQLPSEAKKLGQYLIDIPSFEMTIGNVKQVYWAQYYLNKVIEKGRIEYIDYINTVTSGAEDIFARTGEIVDLLEREGRDVEYLRDLEKDYYNINEDIRKARILAGEIEHKYGRERLKHLNEEIKAGRIITDASSEEIEAAKEWSRLQDFILSKDEERSRIKLNLIHTTSQAAKIAREEGGITWKNIKILDDYTTLVRYFNQYLGYVNDKEALGLALLTKHGSLYQDLKKSIPTEVLQKFSQRLNESIKNGKDVGPVIQELSNYLVEHSFKLELTADGWRLINESQRENIPTTEEIHQKYKKLTEATEDLDEKMQEVARDITVFFNEFNKGWKIVDNFMDAIFGTAEAKTELDRRLKYTAPGIMFRREYGSQIETLENLISEYKKAARAGDINVAAQRRQALMAHVVALAQRVVNDVMAEQNPILRQQKMGWLDLVRYFYQWVYGVTGEIPAATAELDKFAETALNIPSMAELTTYLNLNTDPATAKLNEWIKQNTGKTLEIQITPIMAREITEWIKVTASPAGTAASGEIPAAQTGGYVLRTGYALIHKGEYVLPRELVEEIRRGRKKENIEVNRQLSIHVNNLNVGKAEDFQRFIRELESYYM